jgi:hypothetical protein
MVAVAGLSNDPGDEDGQAETERPEPVLPGTGPSRKHQNQKQLAKLRG